MLKLYNGTIVDEYTAATALTLEARRQGKSYGQLVANADIWEQERIIQDYCSQKNYVPPKPVRTGDRVCGDCALWRRDETSRAGGRCQIPSRRVGTGPKQRHRGDRACKLFEERF